MLDKHMIDKRICHIKEHGDSAQDIRDLAMLLYVKRHMDEDEKHGHTHAITREMAEKWTSGMVNEDPSKPRGAKWTMDQIAPIAQKYGIPTEGERFWEFFAVMNMLYSDYYMIAKKYNVLTADFFADMAMAFISDKDAVENKVSAYYECIVK